MRVLPFCTFALTAALAAATATGCASDAKKRTSTGAGGSSVQGKNERTGPERIADAKFDANGFQRRDLDLNKDRKPDAYQFSKVVEGNVVVVRKEVDVNFDGKIDLIRAFADNGDLVDEHIDTDFDGKIDVVVVFERGVIVRKEYDTNFDQNVDMWRFFDKGVIARKEADLNYDGRIDYWEYWEGGKLDRVGIDRDGDGNVDEWERATEG
jgi:hypothetical protein